MNHADNRLKLAITMGDPASIGPEITIKALQNQMIYNKCIPIVVGDASVLEAALHIVKNNEIKIHSIHSVEEALGDPGTIDVLNLNNIDINLLKRGEISSMCGDAAFHYVKTAIMLAMDHKVDATVTNALNKEAMNLAGHSFEGHTEIYAHYTKTNNYAMLLSYNGLRVIHVSTHVSLREACNRVKKDRVYNVIEMANQFCKNFGIERPRIGVAGLNPHCGEHGLFGTEEQTDILPAIQMAAKEGICVDGPIPPDTIFSKAIGGWYDIVVAMYHDQGHIPLKVKGFVYDQDQQSWLSVAGVNITLGLPIIRTSVDHGTAFELAGKGTASEVSLVNAINDAITLAGMKKGE